MVQQEDNHPYRHFALGTGPTGPVPSTYWEMAAPQLRKHPHTAGAMAINFVLSSGDFKNDRHLYDAAENYANAIQLNPGERQLFMDGAKGMIALNNSLRHLVGEV